MLQQDFREILSQILLKNEAKDYEKYIGKCCFCKESIPVASMAYDPFPILPSFVLGGYSDSEPKFVSANTRKYTIFKETKTEKSKSKKDYVLREEDCTKEKLKIMLRERNIDANFCCRDCFEHKVIPARAQAVRNQMELS